MDRRWHTPSGFAILLTLVGLALFGSLGAWQLSRAAEKERLFAAFAGAGAQTPVSLEEARRMETSPRYPLVHVRGTYDPKRAYILDDQPHAGSIGVVAYAIFEPSDGSTPLLVNRGFVARETIAAKPAVPPPPAGEQELLALYAPPPGSGLHMGGNALPRQSSYPKHSIYLDVGEVAADAGRSLDAKILLLAPEQGSGFVREWRPDVFPPERHRAYALTWFTFATLSLILFVVLHWRKDATT